MTHADVTSVCRMMAATGLCVVVFGFAIMFPWPVGFPVVAFCGIACIVVGTSLFVASALVWWLSRRSDRQVTRIRGNVRKK